MTPCILAIDQGTTNTKVLLVDGEGAVVSRASVSVDASGPAWRSVAFMATVQMALGSVDGPPSAGAA